MLTKHDNFVRCAAAAVLYAAVLPRADAHILVSRRDRAGASPPYEGSGWVAEVYLNIPSPSAATLLTAESYADTTIPDFTFKTAWIDFPAGTGAAGRDSDFATVGDFLNDYLVDVSDPSMLNEPMSHMLIRFRGLLKVTLDDEVRIRDEITLPIWVDIGTMGYDGFRVSVVQTIYRRPDVNPDDVPWDQFGPALGGMGLFPIEIAYFNRYDPFSFLNAPRAGIEVYSWHGSEKAYPAGEQMIHDVFGPGTLMPPRVVYQPEDVLEQPLGDFEGDADVDLGDWRWLQVCYNSDHDAPPFIYQVGCEDVDFNEDGRVGDFDVAIFNSVFDGP